MSGQNRTIVPVSISDTNSELSPLFITSSNDNKNANRQSSDKKCAYYIIFILSLIIAVTIFSRFNIDSNVYEQPSTADDSSTYGLLGLNTSKILLKPFSLTNPTEYFLPIDRSDDSKPNDILSNAQKTHSSFPTNAWCENLLIGSGISENNHVYQIPYVVDAAGSAPGLRTHPVRLMASPREVITLTEPNNALTLSAVEPLSSTYKVASEGQKSIGRLVLALDWFPLNLNDTDTKPYKIQALVARGSPYMSMLYHQATPRILAESSLIYSPIIDGDSSKRLTCGGEPGIFSPNSVVINKHVQLRFHASDMTWMVFFSEPTSVVCSSTALEELSEVPPYFELRSTAPMKKGMVRIALINNCTSGANPRYCFQAKPTDKESFKASIIDHAAIYPSAGADVALEYVVPKYPSTSTSTEKEDFVVRLDWKPRSMYDLSSDDQEDSATSKGGGNVSIPETELLMMSVVHHRQLLMSSIGSSNTIVEDGTQCSPTLYGLACPVLGGSWAVKDELRPVSFGNDHTPKLDMVPDIIAALNAEISYRLPYNYQRGAGDTYFSGKMLSKLARILLVDEGLGGIVSSQEFTSALDGLRDSVEIWLNGSAISPFVFDSAWGGVLNCGCDYNFETTLCNNEYPNCPGVGNMNMNFGFGYYNDHHFHLGYHIYAAAVVAKYDSYWGEKFYERVLFLIRDIANPSSEDPFFVSFRHVDWYLGFSWASGIVQLGGQPYLNGRNWESSSEAISAYEGVALYGEVMANIFKNKLGSKSYRDALRGGGSSSGMQADEVTTAASNYESAVRVNIVGRILTSVTIRAAKTYFHVRSPGTNGTDRVYPDIYAGKAVGMMWSMMMEQQTWFGNEAWKSYGIQMLPLTPISVQRDDIGWLQEMIPQYQDSCEQSTVCINDGWSVPIFMSMARYGQYKKAWRGLQSLNDTVFYTAGGNGHSRVNSLWLIATWANIHG